MTRSSITTQRAALLLGYSCDNACVFCGQADIDLEAPARELTDRSLIELRADHDEISFVGGEPTLDPRLPELVARAKALEFTAIGLQTNGRRLASEPGLFDELISAGLTDLHLSIHAPTALAQDYHTGAPGSLTALLEVLRRAQRAGTTVVATTVVTRSNFRELPKLAPALKRRGIAAWVLEPVRPYGRAADLYARVVPRFGMAIPWALLALEQARRHGLPAWIRGAPLCTLGPFSSSALPDDAPRSGSPELRGFPEPCSTCASRPRCPGVDKPYLDVWGRQEFSARETQPLVPFDEGRARLVRMFVGVGELLERAPQLYTPASAEPQPLDAVVEPLGKHRRLPVLANTPEARTQTDADPE